jgi:flagellar motor switch protein FliN
MADDKIISQDDIEKLLSQGPAKPVATAAPASPDTPGDTQAAPLQASADVNPVSRQAAEAANVQGAEMAEKDIEFLLNQAEKALESIGSNANSELPQGVASFRLHELGGAPASTETATLDLVRDVELNLKIELGRTHMYLEDVLKLRKGSVVPLDKLAGDPVDLYVNGRLVARGEVLVLNDNFCVRVAELITGANVF